VSIGASARGLTSAAQEVAMRVMRAVAVATLLGSAVGVLAHDAAGADLGNQRGRGRIATIEPAPVPDAVPFSWTGLYVGAHAGYGWSDVEWQDGAFSASHDGSGWLAGGQAGYNLQAGRFVYGVEADVSSGWIDGGGDGCCGHSVDWLYSVRGRLGLASIDNRWLFYATGGAAWADVEYRSAGFSGHSETQMGWVAGGGIERALTPRLTARVEYLYYDFDSVTAPPGALGAGATDIDPTMHTVRFGLNFKF
jgi:outer membrane immunogenic protein